MPALLTTPEKCRPGFSLRYVCTVEWASSMLDCTGQRVEAVGTMKS
jgi:hypothetical protein